MPVLLCWREAKLADRQLKAGSLRVAGVSKSNVITAAGLKCRNNRNNYCIFFCSTNITNVTGRTLFHFFFGNHVSIRTRRDVIHAWNDLLCKWMVLVSMVAGVSFSKILDKHRWNLVVVAYSKNSSKNEVFFFFVQCHHMSLWTSWSSLLGMAGV